MATRNTSTAIFNNSNHVLLKSSLTRGLVTFTATSNAGRAHHILGLDPIVPRQVSVTCSVLSLIVPSESATGCLATRRKLLLPVGGLSVASRYFSMSSAFLPYPPSSPELLKDDGMVSHSASLAGHLFVASVTSC
jgi:hypothetical protein